MTGPGFQADILPKIFDPFYTTKRPGRGTGLGLSICKAILREHGGNVEVASGPGGGSGIHGLLTDCRNRKSNQSRLLSNHPCR